MNIGILIIATGKYIEFFDTLHDEIMKYFLPLHKKTIYLFTDAKRAFNDDIVVTKIKRQGYPRDTLCRYHYFLLKTYELLMTTDVVYYMDVDSKILCEIGDQVLPTDEKPLIGCIHPGFWNTSRTNGTPETRQASTAYISPDEVRDFYWCGGINGGKTGEFLKMAVEIANNINVDDKNNIIAIWHDESHLNKYFVNHQKLIKSLSPSYMFPEPFNVWKERLKDLEPKIVALAKNHNEYRKD